MTQPQGESPETVELAEAPPTPPGAVRPTGFFVLLLQFFERTMQEAVRSALAILLLVLLWVTITRGFAFVGGENWANAKEFLNIIIPALSALLGSARGFYFGTRGRQG